LPSRPAPKIQNLGPEASAEIFESVGEAAYSWQLATDALTWSANATKVLGLDSPAAIGSGRAFAALLDPASPVNPYDAIVAGGGCDQGTGCAYELRYSLNLPGATEPCWIEDIGRWFAGPDGKAVRAIGIVRVINERHRREQQLAALSATDPLTGEINRARLTTLLVEGLEQASRHRSNLGFLLIGIDGLSHVNRAYGFDVADQAIAAVAKRLRTRLRTSDALGRFSSSNFGLILYDCTAEDLEIAAQRFIATVREAPVETSAGPIMMSVTAGGVVAPRHARTAAEVLGRALEALDLARQTGRGEFRAFQPSLESEARRRENLRLTDIIIAALNDRRVSLAFQPVVRTDTREIEFREALVRLREPDGRVIDAMSIVAVAEKLDLVRLIDHRVLELAAAELRADPNLVLSINVSASTVHDPVWMAALASEMHDDLGRRLILEITESTAVRDVEATRGFVGRVKSLGCRIAIDDFGAGYTSFRNLRRLGVDIVKIDGSFVANLERTPDDRLFVQVLLGLGRALGLKTVAEWVQTESAAAMLATWGCDYLQGTLIGAAETRPDPAAVKKEIRASAG
jgi:diguanylate cyclase (GGDEF)-like protein